LVAVVDWSLDMKADRADATAMGDGNKRTVQGLPDISGSLSAIWDDEDDNLYDGSQSDDGVKIYLYPSSLNLTKYWYGPAWVDFSITVGVGDAVKLSGSFGANGDWGQM
jgi:hypothetical protein